MEKMLAVINPGWMAGFFSCETLRLVDLQAFVFLAGEERKRNFSLVTASQRSMRQSYVKL